MIAAPVSAPKWYWTYLLPGPRRIIRGCSAVDQRAKRWDILVLNVKPRSAILPFRACLLSSIKCQSLEDHHQSNFSMELRTAFYHRRSRSAFISRAYMSVFSLIFSRKCEFLMGHLFWNHGENELMNHHHVLVIPAQPAQGECHRKYK